MDTLDAMKVFRRVAEVGGFAEAARQLDLAPASVTRAVQSLEERTGLRLLHRTTRSMRLTESGERYLQMVRRALTEIEAVEDALRGERTREVSGTLRLSMPVALGTRYLVPLLAQFKAEHPQLRMDLDFSDGPVDVLGQGFDAAIRVSMRLADSSLNARSIGSSPVVIAASAAYLQRAGTPRTLEDLRKHQMLEYSHQQGELTGGLRLVGSEREAAPASSIRANSGEALKGFAIAGLGLVQAPTFLLADELADGRLERLLPQVPLGEYIISIVFPERAFLPQRTRRLIDHLAARLGTAFGVANSVAPISKALAA